MLPKNKTDWPRAKLGRRKRERETQSDSKQVGRMMFVCLYAKQRNDRNMVTERVCV